MAADGNANGNSGEVARILADIPNDQSEAMKILEVLAKQDHRSRQCLVSSNADVVLASAFSLQPIVNIDFCEDAIGALALILPMSAESRGLLASFDALRRIAWILGHGSPESRGNAVLILQELMRGSDGMYRERIGAVDGLAEGLVEVLREGISPAATKASLNVIYDIAGGRRVRVKVVQAGAVPVLLELLPEADRGTCERAVACLYVVCHSCEGRSAAKAHALAIPILAKKLLRVSELTTEFAVCILWRMCSDSSNESLLVDAVEVGVFDKVVLLLQIGCSAKARERAAQLVKLLSNYTFHCECHHAMDSNSKHIAKC